MSNPQKNIELNHTEEHDEKSHSNREVLYSFPEQGIDNWRVQNDVVMGGRSDSQIKMTTENHAQFSGRVSLENNGGFCSMRRDVADNPYVISDASTAFVLHLKGDGKDYNFRVRTPSGRHSYSSKFSTRDGKWETISIPFNTMEATYRGRSIEVPNYAGDNIVELRILIGNKKEESFDLVIESIGVI